MSRSMWCALLVAVTAGSGCAGSRSAQRETTTLRAQVAELKAERRRDKRTIRDLQKQLLLEKQDEPAAADTSLPVEVRGPEPTAVAPEPPLADDGDVAYVTENGVEVVYVGEAAKQDSVRPTLELHESTSRRAYPTARARPPVEPVPRPKERLAVVDGKVPPIAAAPAASADPRDEYKAHYQALRDGDHDGAIAGFRDFVERHPAHDYADNAQYWLGEAYYDRRDYKAALAEFRKVVENYPKGNKVGDAMLKSAYCYEQLGHFAKARDVLGHIVKKFPKSNAAVLAADRLVNLESD